MIRGLARCGIVFGFDGQVQLGGLRDLIVEVVGERIEISLEFGRRRNLHEYREACNHHINRIRHRCRVGEVELVDLCIGVGAHGVELGDERFFGQRFGAAAACAHCKQQPGQADQSGRSRTVETIALHVKLLTRWALGLPHT